jgi:hypothetical protein
MTHGCVTVVREVSNRIDYSNGERSKEATWKTRRSIGPITLSIRGPAARRSLRDAPIAMQNAWIHGSFTAKRADAVTAAVCRTLAKCDAKDSENYEAFKRGDDRLAYSCNEPAITCNGPLVFALAATLS